MKIELKNIKYSEHLSDDSNAFTANLYINGKHAGFVQDQGMGGSIDYRGKDAEGAALIKEAEKYCKLLPPIDMAAHYSDGKEHSLGMDLELFIAELLEKYLDERQQKKMEKQMDKGFLVGIPDVRYEVFSYKNTSLKEYLQHPKGPDMIQKLIERDIIPELKNNVMLLNTNIPESILIAAGLKPEQYQKKLIHALQKESSKPRQKPRMRP